MTKYHIKKDGTPGLCKAKKACPLGGSEVHFESQKEAQNYVEKKYAEQYGILPVSETTSESYLYSNYEKVKGTKGDPGSYERFLQGAIVQLRNGEGNGDYLQANYSRIKGKKEDPGSYHKFLENTISEMRKG